MRADPPWPAYSEALETELLRWLNDEACEGRRIESVFFGGGTPSLAPPVLIKRILELLAKAGRIAPDAEITLEANPNSAEAARFAELRALGVNRLSIGVQSLDDAELNLLDRIHRADESLAAIEAAERAGFDELNIDLIYGLPGQRIEEWLARLERAAELPVTHLSCYMLTIEPGTKLASIHRRTPLALPDEHAAAAMLAATRAHLAGLGFPAYEISNHARPGHECRHNDAYWRYRDYIGIGAGAAGKLDRPDGGAFRWTNRRRPESYIRQVREEGRAVAETEILDAWTAAREAAWLGLRRSEGLVHGDYQRRFGRPAWERLLDALAPWIDTGHAVHDARGLRLSERGVLLADEIAAGILSLTAPDAARAAG